jgi:hypothetical protein
LRLLVNILTFSKDEKRIVMDYHAPKSATGCVGGLVGGLFSTLASVPVSTEDSESDQGDFNEKNIGEMWVEFLLKEMKEDQSPKAIQNRTENNFEDDFDENLSIPNTAAKVSPQTIPDEASSEHHHQQQPEN